MNFFVTLLITLGFMAFDGLINEKIEPEVLLTDEQIAEQRPACNAIAAFISVACLLLAFTAFRLSQYKGHLTEWPPGRSSIPNDV
jgi:hypothetical protein